jgi:hypothetical protein
MCAAAVAAVPKAITAAPMTPCAAAAAVLGRVGSGQNRGRGSWTGDKILHGEAACAGVDESGAQQRIRVQRDLEDGTAGEEERASRRRQQQRSQRENLPAPRGAGIGCRALGASWRSARARGAP